MASTTTDGSKADSRRGVDAWQLPVAQLCDSALPTGAFSHSFGLETYVDEGAVADETSFAEWLRRMVRVQLAYSDGFAIRAIMEALGHDEARSVGLDDIPVVWAVDRQLWAHTMARQVREANATMGKRMADIACATIPNPWVDAYAKNLRQGHCHGHPAVVLALDGAYLKAPTAAIIAAHTQAVATSLTQNAVRAIPLGQNAGQRVIAAIRPDIDACVDAVFAATWDDFGAVVPGLEIAQMRHERLRSRMYMS